MDPELYKLVKDERHESDDRYAIKLVERIVFGAVGMILMGMISALLLLVSRQ